MAGCFLVPETRLDLIPIVDYIMDERSTSALRVHERFLEIFGIDDVGMVSYVIGKR